MIVRKGIFYFASYSEAKCFAIWSGYPTNRIIPYEIGWAIQLYVSGPYVGISN